MKLGGCTQCDEYNQLAVSIEPADQGLVSPRGGRSCTKLLQMHFIAHIHSSVNTLLSTMVCCVWRNDHSIDDFDTYLFYFEAKLHHYTLLSDCHYHRL